MRVPPAVVRLLWLFEHDIGPMVTFDDWARPGFERVRWIKNAQGFVDPVPW